MIYELTNSRIKKAIDHKSTKKEKTLKDKVKKVVVKRIEESGKEQLQKSSEN